MLPTKRVLLILCILAYSIALFSAGPEERLPLNMVYPQDYIVLLDHQCKIRIRMSQEHLDMVEKNKNTMAVMYIEYHLGEAKRLLLENHVICNWRNELAKLPHN